MARIAIVGAGPSGSSAAYHLAKNGHAVTLIDRAQFPRAKTCGDWLTPMALRELARLGLDGPTLDRQALGRTVIRSSILASPDGRRSRHAFATEGSCLPRLLLDDLVRSRALAAGCEPMRRALRELDHGDGAFLNDFEHVIDARGAHAGVPNAVALRAYWTIRREHCAPDAVSSVQIHTDAAYRRGYGWIFPVHMDDASVRFNVGVGLWKSDSRLGHSVADYYDHFVQHNAVARSLRDAAQDLGRPVGYHVALARWRSRVAKCSVLAIGDAANFADPLTGDGIGNALASGRLLAETLAEHAGIDRERLAVKWQRKVDAELAAELRAALVLRHALVSTRAKNLASRIVRGARSGVGARLHGAIFGETSYREAWSRSR